MKIAGLLGGCILSLVIGLAAICHTWSSPLGVCSGIFASGGYHLLNGKTLYTDVWDHKPPIVFLLNEGAQYLVGPVAWSARVLDASFVVLGCILMFFIANKVLKHTWLAILITALFAVHFTAPVIYEDGNIAEGYASVFVLGGILATLEAMEAPKADYRWDSLAGALFALATWTKEPFILMALPCFVLLAIRRGKISASMFFGGGCFIGLVFLGWLLWHNNLGDWLDSLSFGFRQAQVQFSGTWFDRLLINIDPSYEKVLSLSIAGQALLCLCVAAVPVLLFLKDPKAYLPMLALGLFGTAYVGTCISLRATGNYYVQLVPAYSLCMLCGVYLLMKSREHCRAPAAAALGLLVIIVACESSAWERPQAKPYSDPMAARIQQLPQGGLWVECENLCRYYVVTRRLSPTRYFFFGQHLLIDTAKTTRQQKIDQLTSELETNPPVGIVLFCDQFELLDRIGLKSWVLGRYKLDMTNSKGVQLWVLRDIVS